MYPLPSLAPCSQSPPCCARDAAAGDGVTLPAALRTAPQPWVPRSPPALAPQLGEWWFPDTLCPPGRKALGSHAAPLPQPGRAPGSAGHKMGRAGGCPEQDRLLGQRMLWAPVLCPISAPQEQQNRTPPVQSGSAVASRWEGVTGRDVPGADVALGGRNAPGGSRSSQEPGDPRGERGGDWRRRPHCFGSSRPVPPAAGAPARSQRCVSGGRLPGRAGDGAAASRRPLQ